MTPTLHSVMLARICSNIKKHPFVWVMLVFALVILGSRVFSGRFEMSDLLVAYSANHDLFAGGTVYDKTYPPESDVAFYKYSPSTLFLLLPLALLPYDLTKIIYFSLSACLLISLSFFLEAFLTKHFFAEKKAPKCHKILFLSALIAAVHYERELHLGNYNILLLGALLLSLNLVISQQHALAGLLIAQVILMKPHFIILLPLLLLRKQFRTLAAIAAGIGLGLIFPAFILGWEKNVELHSAWFQTMLEHNAELSSSKNTLQAWLHKSLLHVFIPDPGQLYPLLVILGVALLIFFFVMRNSVLEHEGNSAELAKRHFIFEYLFLIALIPNIVHTDTEHFLWSLPIIMFLLSYLFYQHRQMSLLTLFAIIAFTLYGGDWYELWGRDISRWIQYNGLLGLGNMLLLLLALYALGESQPDCRDA
ncbi:MAG: DUF2029 domain-containing protein [bacterium]|nr:DUF2029 domain-containing protein [bacterium]